MTSVGRRLQVLNFRGRATKSKKTDRDDCDGEHSAYVALRKSSVGNLSSMGVSKQAKSNSLGNVITDVDGSLDQDGILSLTQDVRCFSDSLAQLKKVFVEEGEEGDARDGHPIHVQAHKELGEVLFSLRSVLGKYPALHTTDVLTAAAVLITKVKSANYEDLASELNDLNYSIDQLALAFSSSVSEYLMGDVDAYSTIGKSKSFDNLTGSEFGSIDNLAAREGLPWNPDELDHTLLKMEDGVDIALSRAKAWSKYAKDVATYVEKRAQLEMEFAKNLSKLAVGVRHSITDDSYLPFQSIYCTALDHDRELASTTQTCSTLIQTEKFVEPLMTRRLDHERTRKTIKDTWTRELRKMHESVGNVRKAKAMYIQRQIEYDKARELAARAEQDGAASSTSTAKVDKKRKLEEEAMHRAIEAETTYKACVIEANDRQQELERVKAEVLVQIREIISECDQAMKSVTIAYFQLQHAATAPLPVQYQTLCESSEQYEPGAQYAEYIRHLPVPSSTNTPEPFTFEAFTAESKMYNERKPSTQSSGSGSSDIQGFGEESPSPSRHTEKSRLGLKGWGHGGSDSDSISGSSCKSRESSPSASPYQRHRNTLVTSSSMNELAEADRDAQFESRAVPSLSDISQGAFRAANLSKAARTHVFRKLRTPSKCRQCDSYVYFQGAECEKCGISSHKKCLEALQYECGHNSQQRRMTTFGVDLKAHVGESETLIPHLICKCAAEIDQRGLHVKGIYRVSGVKSKVERLCQSFEINEGNVDLSEHHPNVIANVLKLYLRQLPEPLLSFHLYPHCIQLAKALALEDRPLFHYALDMALEEPEDFEEMVERIKALMAQLPPAHFKTCAMLMHHLHRVSDNKEFNQMTAANLGIVFGPTLLRPSEGAASLNSLMDTPLQTRIVEILILRVEDIFGAEEKKPVPETDNEAAGEDAEGPVEESEFENGVQWSESQKKGTRYIPDVTENLLEELAKEEPRFMQVRDDYVNLPGSAETEGPPDSQSDQMAATAGAEGDQATGTDVDLDSDEALPEILLPDGSTSSQPIIVPDPAELLAQAEGSSDGETKRPLRGTFSAPSPTGSDSSGMSASPGLKRRLKASELRTRPKTAVIGNSSFFTGETNEQGSSQPKMSTLSQPRAFTPPEASTQDLSDSDNASLGLSTFYAPSIAETVLNTSTDSQSVGRQSGTSTPEDREPMYV